MASERGIRKAWATLTANGLQTPKTWTDDPVGEVARAGAMRTWLLALPGPDDGLRIGVQAYLSGPDARFWPMPGQIRALVPPSPARQITGPVEDTAYNRLTDAQRREILDVADAEGWWSLDNAECWRRIDESAKRSLVTQRAELS